MPAISVWSVSAPLSCPLRGRHQRGERLAVDVERVGAEPGDAGHLRRRPDDVDRQPLAGALLGEVEAVAVVEMHAQRERALARLGRCGRQVSRQCSQPARARWTTRCSPETSRSRNLPCRPAPVISRPPSADSGGSKVLIAWTRGEVGPRQHAADGVLAEERGQRLHLGQLGHRDHDRPPDPPRPGAVPDAMSRASRCAEPSGPHSARPSSAAPRASSYARAVPAAVLWFRRDLRLADHPALLAARDAAGPDARCSPSSCSTTGSGARPGDPRRRFLLDCLADLREQTGGALVLRSGDPEQVIPQLVGRGRRDERARLRRRRPVRPAARRRRRARARRRAAGAHRLALRRHPGPRDQGRRHAVPGLHPVRPRLAGARLARAGAAPGRRPLAHRRPLRRPTAGGPADADLPPAGEAAALARLGTVPRRAAGRLRRRRATCPASTAPAGCRPTSSTAASTRARCSPTSPGSRANPPAGTPTSWPGGSSTPTSCGTGPSRRAST